MSSKPSFDCDIHTRDRASLLFFKHLVLAYLPMTIGFIFSPVAEAIKATVNRSLDFLPPLHFFAFSDKFLSGRAQKKQPHVL